jgi:pyruvate/2-oxoglutarate dehydrogenase complex dihydrolipoamide acyltransferase (E2) component
MQEFKVPELGENVEQGDVTRVLVKVGDTISPEQPVIELETDKATIEVPSSVAGVVKDIKVKAGDKVKVGAIILTVEDGSTSPARQWGRRSVAPRLRSPKRNRSRSSKTRHPRKSSRCPSANLLHRQRRRSRLRRSAGIAAAGPSSRSAITAGSGASSAGIAISPPSRT